MGSCNLPHSPSDRHRDKVSFGETPPLRTAIGMTEAASTVRLQIGVVEDNDDLRDSLVELLMAQGHRVAGFESAEDLFERNHGLHLQLMVLDLNLPGEDGLSLAARLKQVQPSLRVLMMTTRTSLPDRVLGYGSGADLYLPKPVEEAELVAAVEALARQIRAELGRRLPVGTEALRLELQTLKLHGPSGAVALNRREVSLLTAVGMAPGQRLEHWQLLEALGLSVEAHGKTALAVCMTRLRSKFVEVGIDKDALKSLRSEGYQLCCPLQIL